MLILQFLIEIFLSAKGLFADAIDWRCEAALKRGSQIFLAMASYCSVKFTSRCVALRRGAERRSAR
jgi:hypothetical protein